MTQRHCVLLDIDFISVLELQSQLLCSIAIATRRRGPRSSIFNVARSAGIRSNALMILWRQGNSRFRSQPARFSSLRRAGERLRIVESISEDDSRGINGRRRLIATKQGNYRRMAPSVDAPQPTAMPKHLSCSSYHHFPPFNARSALQLDSYPRSNTVTRSI
jgi:hypothetical protein